MDRGVDGKRSLLRAISVDPSLDEHEQVRDAWTRTIHKRFRDLLREARDSAIVNANNFDGEDYTVLKPYNPPWMKEVYWHDLIDRETYDRLMMEKHGSDPNTRPRDDPELWEKSVGGWKKGRLFGFGTTQDPSFALIGESTSRNTGRSYVTGLSLEALELQEKNKENGGGLTRTGEGASGTRSGAGNTRGRP